MNFVCVTKMNACMNIICGQGALFVCGDHLNQIIKI